MTEVMVRLERLRRPSCPTLEVIEAMPAPGTETGAPLLLLHGAFSGAWCWQERFLRLLAAQGRHAVALSLRGHGSSEGKRGLRLTTIEDFLTDVHAAIRNMPRPPIVVGHSLGGYLAQLVLGVVPLSAVVLMGSLPPDGLTLVGPRMAFTDPVFWAEGVLGSAGRSKSATELAALDVLFGKHMTPADRIRFARQMVPESPVALGQTHLPRWVLPAQAAGIPALVMQGAEDRMIWEGTALRTACYHGAELARIPGGSHFFMLDDTAARAASLLVDWLRSRRI